MGQQRNKDCEHNNARKIPSTCRQADQQFCLKFLSVQEITIHLMTSPIVRRIRLTKLYQFNTIETNMDQTWLFQLRTTISEPWLFSFLYLPSHTCNTNTQIIEFYDISASQPFQSSKTNVRAFTPSHKMYFWIYMNLRFTVKKYQILLTIAQKH